LWTEVDAAPSLSQIALSKPIPKFELLDLHLQLASVLHMIAVFDLKISNIVTSLFDLAVSTLMSKR
jgi:hypothetical protein